MDQHDLIIRLRTVAAKARDLHQVKAAREIEALIEKLGAKYYFLVSPGGYQGLIKDKEYVEFPDEPAVVNYVKETLLQQGPGSTPGEMESVQPEIDFQTARKMLMDAGEFGPLATPITPPDPNTLVGSGPELSFEDFKRRLQKIITEGKMETIDGVDIDVEKASLLLTAMSGPFPILGPAAMAMGVMAMLRRAYQVFEAGGEALHGMGRSLGLTSAEDREGAFYKEIAPFSLDEEWLKDLDKK